jgi:hypothetical protein
MMGVERVPSAGMNSADRDFFQQRAEAELKLAQNAKDGRVVRAHYTLANLYLERIHHPGESASGKARRGGTNHA